MWPASSVCNARLLLSLPLTKVFCYSARFRLTIKMLVEFITIDATKRFRSMHIAWKSELNKAKQQIVRKKKKENNYNDQKKNYTKWG